MKMTLDISEILRDVKNFTQKLSAENCVINDINNIYALR